MNIKEMLKSQTHLNYYLFFQLIQYVNLYYLQS